MNLIRKSTVFLLFLCSVSCEKEFNTIGTTLISNTHFETDKAYINVYAYNRKINAVQSNGLPVYQLGRITDPVYGETQAQIATQLVLQNINPVFGLYTQEQEDNAATDNNNLTIAENETISEVYLNIPFFSTVTDTDEQGNRTFRIDSILGNISAPFNLKVEELTLYLRDLDPETNFETPQNYFSDQDFSSFTAAVLFDEMYTIDPTEIVIFEEDDPETEENEAENVKERIDPRIRIPLDPLFFQQKIIDAEGSESLISNSNFKAYLKGLYISMASFSDDILMTLNIAQATIDIQYDYDRIDTNGTEQTTDDKIITTTSTIALNLAGQIVNTYASSPYPATIADQLNAEVNASKLYLKGGAGTLVELRLFDNDDSGVMLNQIRENNWLINEANLTFYVDRTTLDVVPGTVREPQRIYLYNLEDGVPLLDYLLDPTASLSNSQASRTLYSGLLQTDEQNKGTRYKIRLTEHLNNIIRKDSTNVTLGLLVTSDINTIAPVTAILNPMEMVSVTTGSVISPLGTVLHGADVSVEEDKRLRLEIFYTQPDN